MKLKLLSLPLHQTNVSGENSQNPIIPPLSTATLKGYLENNGMNVEQDDLSIKTEVKNLFIGEDNINLGIFDKKENLMEILSNKFVPSLENEARKILQLTDIKKFDVIGLSIMNSNNFSSITLPIVLSKLIKESEDPIVIIGGNIRAGVDEKILRSGYVDYRIIGDSRTSLGEVNLLRFLKKYENGNMEDLDGISHIENDKHIYRHGNRTEEEKSIVTKPVFEGLPIELYKEVIGRRTGKEFLILPYFSMRGCPHNCAHCSQSRENNFTIKDRKKAVREIKELSEKYDTKYFMLLDSEIVKPIEFANEIIKKDVRMMYSTSADFRNISVDSLENLKKSGVKRLIFGLENGSDKMRIYLNKKIDEKKAEKILERSYDLGIENILTLICGFPWERRKDVRETYNFLRKNNRYIESSFLNKFFLDGKFIDNPKEMNIKLKKVSGPLGKESLKFEEIGGRNWSEIKEFRKYSYKTLDNVIRHYFGKPKPIDMFFAEVGDVDE
ncbi:MAG: radical SAM protein [Candidatus Aenigmatarchaeota archaeon]